MICMAGVQTSESYINAIIASAQVGEFNVVIGPDPLGNNYTEHHSDQSISKYASGGTFEGRVSFRPVESGAYKVFIIHTTSRKLVSPVHKLSVQVRIAKGVLNNSVSVLALCLNFSCKDVWREFAPSPWVTNCSGDIKSKTRQLQRRSGTS